jgi:hypothetical protein
VLNEGKKGRRWKVKDGKIETVRLGIGTKKERDKLKMIFI